MATNPIFIPRRQAPVPEAYQRPDRRRPAESLPRSVILTPAGVRHQTARQRAALIGMLAGHAGVEIRQDGWDAFEASFRRWFRREECDESQPG